MECQEKQHGTKSKRIGKLRARQHVHAGKYGTTYREVRYDFKIEA